MDRVFLDADALFSAAYRTDSDLGRLWELDIELITSEYAIEEARRNLDTDGQRRRLAELERSITIVHTPMPPRLVPLGANMGQRIRLRSP